MGLPAVLDTTEFVIQPRDDLRELVLLPLRARHSLTVP
jgi:hypothetical protein